MTGITIAQAIPIATGKYEMAIMLSKRNEDAINIFITMILLVLILFFSKNFALLLHHPEIEFWLYFVVEDPFAILFGDEWRVAGEYAKILLPFMFVNFIVGSISIVFEKNHKFIQGEIFNAIL